MDCGGSGFQYLRLKFTKVIEAKMKEGIFVRPQFIQLMKDPVFEINLTKKQWTSFKELAKHFFRNNKASITCLKACKTMLMQHVVENTFHLEFFPENLGTVSDENGEWFHQDI
ncbi:hypothetical protein AVEN_225645-1 [Araneus ventricosus]|uniref:Uncharacterized protein n=1 Tax=Araneus ventricosus TaxID=182803 RepID=A0A4Y2EL14_ARAVE|nr:hypothetical protein AVEN_225645-1 [Araneus ventricosus]